MLLLRSPAALVGLMCLAEVFSMQGFGSFAAPLPELRRQWGLSYASAGWAEGAFQAGYLITVPVLVPLTDRADARRIFAGAAVIGGLASLAFAAFAQGLWFACLFRALAGCGRRRPLARLGRGFAILGAGPALGPLLLKRVRARRTIHAAFRMRKE